MDEGDHHVHGTLCWAIVLFVELPGERRDSGVDNE
jgi:hypothetical protein